MANLEALTKLIREQQGKDTEPRYMIGEQLLEMAQREPQCAEILEKDLVVKEMSLAAAEQELKKYADKHHGSARTFCITPKVADGILREFYGLPKAGEVPAKETPAAPEGYIDLSSFL